ncbi:MAG: methyltransferase domain-containing protein, partial [Chitinophagaceae bacterium]
FLSSNSINVFLYNDQPERGISSTPDAAIVSGRPLAISKSRLFRHLFHCTPSICVEDNSIKQIIANGIKPIEHLWKEWDAKSLIWEYDRIISDISSIKDNGKFKNRQHYKFLFNKTLSKFGLRKNIKLASNIWTKIEDEYVHTIKSTHVSYTPIDLRENLKYNCILDNDARVRYKTTIDFLSDNLPELIAKKIPEANVQQAFVMDTSVLLAAKFSNAKILAVGSFEDTAVEGLKLLNYNISDIDPILNYDLQTFITKPSVKSGMYDIIISTSVIEHVDDDEQFVKDIAYLLKIGGYAVLTCDYNDKYKKGDEIPSVDFRFYTMYDLKERLMKAIPNCELIDEPQWECENPDFYLVEKYNYTFASFVFRKIK